MIHMIQNRYRGFEHFGPDEFDTTVSDALERFVIYELGYGGSIVDIKIDDEKNFALVSVETTVMNCRDTTDFSGDVAEMQLLLEVAVLAHEHHGLASEESLSRVADDVMQFTKGNPLLIKMGADLIAGQHTLKNICMAIAGASAENDVFGLGKLSFKDMLAAVLMAHEGDCTLEEAVQLAQ